MTPDSPLPPLAPGRLPLLGHALSMVGGNDRLAFVQGLRRHGPIVRIAVGPKRVTVINDHRLIHQLLTSQADKFSKGLLFEKLKLFGNDALPVAEGKAHLRRRREVQPAFHRELINGYVTTMRETVEGALAGWADGAELDLKTEMQLITQGVVMSALFSSNPPRDPAQRILESVDTVFMTALRRALLPLPVLERLPTPGNRRAETASRVLRDAVQSIIDEHTAHEDAYDDVVSLLLGVRDEHGRPPAADDILSEVTGLLAAGSETTAVVMAWMFFELARNPGLERRLHEEVDAVLTGAPLTLDDLRRLPFTARLVKETLRLYSPAWLVTRQATADVAIGDTTLPAGTDVIFSPYALHRDPELYPDPERFDPDRWLPERPQPPKSAFIPFGSGKRMCMGDAFATTEATVIAALVASRWRLRPAPGHRTLPIGAITVHPSELRMLAESRQRVPAEAAV